MNSRRVDVAVIGGGIAGVSLACELTLRGRRVALVEREPQLAHHTTGRSAAVFLASYGPAPVRALSRASRPLFDEFVERLGTGPLLEPREALWLAPESQVAHLEGMLAEIDTLRRITPDDVVARCPVIRREGIAAAAIEPDAAGIDVLGLHQGYVRTARAHGLTIDTSWPVTAIERRGGVFRLAAAGATLDAEQVVLAAGAWCDVLGELAGARPLGLAPLRRTIAVCPTKVSLDPGGPLVSDADHQYYWKPDGPNVLCSPADETPSDPCDARPDELDVALAIERVNETTTLALRSVVASWAGLRTFAPDRVPVAGEDPDVAGLWWLAGQGGYGIQTAPALAQLMASLMCAQEVPSDLIQAGVVSLDLAPGRLRV